MSSAWNPLPHLLWEGGGQFLNMKSHLFAKTKSEVRLTHPKIFQLEKVAHDI
jgi:hypothetical protein